VDESSGSIINRISSEGSITLLGGSQITLGEFQDIYSKISGISSEESREFAAAFSINLQHILQLEILLRQMFLAIGAKSIIGGVIVYYVGGQKSQFKSFDDFEKDIHIGSMRPIENIRVRFNAVVSSGDGTDIRPYTVEVDMTSTNALSVGDKEFASIPAALAFFRRKSIRYKIKYSDSVVMRVIVSTLEDWAKSHSLIEPNSLLRWAQLNSYRLRTIMPLLTISLLLAYVGWAISEESASVLSVHMFAEKLTYITALSLASLIMLKELGQHLGKV
jgi:hypothetical protein